MRALLQGTFLPVQRTCKKKAKFSYRLSDPGRTCTLRALDSSLCHGILLRRWALHLPLAPTAYISIMLLRPAKRVVKCAAETTNKTNMPSLIPSNDRHYIVNATWIGLLTRLSSLQMRFNFGESCSFLIVSLSKSLLLYFMCSDQHVKYRMLHGFLLTSSLLFDYHVRQYIHKHLGSQLYP